MKKMNYTRPVAKIIKFDEENIVTASGFNDTIGGGGSRGIALTEGDFKADVKDGTIALKLVY